MFSKKRHLKKLKNLFLSERKHYIRSLKRLSPTNAATYKTTLEKLQAAVISEDTHAGKKASEQLSAFRKKHAFRSVKEIIFDAVMWIVPALIFAVLIRGIVFELYQIPSGSMRPTLNEQNLVYVSKSKFGFNIPLSKGHLHYNESALDRSTPFTFTGNGMDIRNGRTLHFYIMPGYKTYVKRLMGKGGDSLYFYGGNIYGIDKDGNDISNMLQRKELNHIAHIPMYDFGIDVTHPFKKRNGITPKTIISQMNTPVASLSVNSQGEITGEVLYPKNTKNKNTDYYDLFGMGNFAKTRIIKEKNQFFLSLIHHPSVKNNTFLTTHNSLKAPMFSVSRSILPLSIDDIKNIFSKMTTSRFRVQDGFAAPYSKMDPPITCDESSHFYPKLLNIPNGVYEFYRGKGYQVYPLGIRFELDTSHPLMNFSLKNTVTLFNAGIELDRRYLQESGYTIFPSRFTYFRNGDLYLLDSPFMKKSSPHLDAFNKNEITLHAESSSHIPFIDEGIPTKETILKYGYKVPLGHFLALGDNYAVSADSRIFGAVPKDNTQGIPEYIFWPYGTNFGPIYSPGLFTLSFISCFIWVLAISITSTIVFIVNRRNRLPLDIP